jgi:urea transport system substrate-binding protein
MSAEKRDLVDAAIGNCLPREDILSLVAGKQSSDKVGRMIAHISDCRKCCDVAQAAGLDAPLVALLKRQAEHAASNDTSTSNRTENPTSQVPSFPSVPGSTPSVPGSTPSPVAKTPPPPTAGQYSFLLPPELPDELGRIGQYRILKVLGEGGMGIVFEADDLQLYRRVAIKILRFNGLDDTTRQRFMQEARLLASLHSERIVTIFQIGDHQGFPYLVMELLLGETLEDYLGRKGKLGISETLQIAREVAEGLAISHEKSLIHRDIKPANIWLEQRAKGRSYHHVKLLDFGIARSLNSESNLTVEGRIIGTPNFMCPEQACGQPLDSRSDLFSLGCVIYAMLVGNSPFDRQNTMLSIRAVAEAELPPMRETMPHAPKPVIDFISRLLSKNPANRPATARQVVDEIHTLEAWGPASLPASTGVPTIVREAATATRRRGMNWGGWVGVAMFVIAGLVGLGFEYKRFLGRNDTPRETRKAEQNAVPVVAFPADGKSETPTVPPSLPPLKVGILHSLSGPMAASERSVVDAFTFAIDEINDAGGVLGGRMIEPVIRDGKSYDTMFAEQAVELIDTEKVTTIFGVWRSSCRQRVEMACQGKDYLLVYPTSYEGLEESPNVIYMGGTANQQITPGIKWAYAFLGKRKFFLIGTDGMFSHAAHEIIQEEVSALGASVVGNEYGGVSDTDFSPIAKQIVESGADIIVNSVVGIGNIHLFSSLRQAGIRSDKIPVLSLNVTEEDLRTMAPRGEDAAGNYAAWSYFQSLPNPKNQQFVAKFRKRFGSTRIINDPMVAAYSGMHLWALAVNAAKSDQVDDIRKAIVQQRFEGPEGLVTIDPRSQIARRHALIGEVNRHFEFDVVWASPRPLEPVPYPPSRSREDWDEFVRSVRSRFSHRWSLNSD